MVDGVARLFFSYFFAWCSFASILILYALIFIYIRKTIGSVADYIGEQDKLKQKENYGKHFKKLAAYPIVFLIQWIPATINRAQNAIVPESPVAWLFGIHVLLVLSSGFINMFIYGGFNHKSIRRQIRKWKGLESDTTEMATQSSS